MMHREEAQCKASTVASQLTGLLAIQIARLNNVMGCPLAAIMILELWLQDAYISTICRKPLHVRSSGQQHAF
jgi:hypothetical protein